MNPIRTLIVDDEAPARSRIRKLLSVDPDIAVIGECSSGEAAVLAVQRESPDLVFLDIHLPGLDGFDVLDRVAGEANPLIVFVTAYDEHAVKAFGIGALDYLVKPFERAQLYTAVGRAKRQLHARAALASRAAARPPSRTPGGRIAIRTDGRVVRLRLDEIEWVEAERDTSHLHLRGGVVVVAREGLSNIEQRLPEALFLRVHRSRIVNIAHVREVHPWFQGESLLVLEDGTRIVTGRTYRDRIRHLSQ
jgi:two-component system, LytTR family, response regulator